MESRAKLLGHPIHQMLVPLPLGLLVMAVIFDVIYMVNENELLAIVSFWNIVAGIATGLLAAVFGLIDWLAIAPATRAKRVGAVHGIGNVVLVALFAAVVLLRRDEPGHVPGTTAFALELMGLALGSVTGWLGGELVDRLGVGVDDGAHLNAPSSMSRHAAGDGPGPVVEPVAPPRAR